MMMMCMIIYINLLIMVLISIAFLTLLERKILSYIQLRKGPNKISYMGLLQPFSDAIKLFIKEFSLILKSNFYIYLLSPMFSMMLMLLLWILMPMLSLYLNKTFNFMLILCLLSMGVYSMILAGWSSNSIYSMIGAMRSIAQTISYEVSMIFIMFSLIYLIESFNLYKLMINQKFLWFLFLNFFMMLIMLMSMLAELNRTPFDLSEGESELVSGFNIEYMGGSFAMIFISEYGMILLMMYLFSLFYLGGNIYKLYFYMNFMLMIYLIIWIRGTLPRIRYDQLMNLTWLKFLPFSMNFLIFILMIKMLM